LPGLQGILSIRFAAVSGDGADDYAGISWEVTLGVFMRSTLLLLLIKVPVFQRRHSQAFFEELYKIAGIRIAYLLADTGDAETAGF
jgi:hypothetical protein